VSSVAAIIAAMSALAELSAAAGVPVLASLAGTATGAGGSAAAGGGLNTSAVVTVGAGTAARVPLSALRGAAPRLT
jgi:hypothetical protein